MAAEAGDGSKATSQFRYNLPCFSPKWETDSTCLRAPIESYEALQDLILRVAVRSEDDSFVKELPALRLAIELCNEHIKGFDFFGKILPKMQEWALALPSLFEGVELGVLVAGTACRIRISRIQARSLLATAFFCLLPEFDRDQRLGHFGTISFLSLYANSSKQGVAVARIQCQLNYFYHVTLVEPLGDLTFLRKCGADPVDWEHSTIPLCSVELTSVLSIEASPAGAHVDFANRDLHIGCIIPSATQEEVVFSVRPECFIGLLFSDRMRNDEVIVIDGARQFNVYTGYQQTFTFAGSHPEALQPAAPTAQVIAMDSVMNRGTLQYTIESVHRDLLKCYLGFADAPEADGGNREGLLVNTVSTGNWGCGIFRCDPVHKFVQQVLVATVAGKDLHYSTFGDGALCERLQELHHRMKQKKVLAGDLYDMLVKYEPGSGSFLQYVNARVESR
mmetsp:Transcript_21446/g.50445  ORF Transcript_21446/g.50445 Transcript_21446/m.50445 type:complete len:449 (-) Transcript_21446:224-1570(-)|eukprot:CAMPEP_0114559742 /NCGR_PEP_ID=MMETSP0114-20121206/11082_1 /TAXON_ID=31324 /ORGANISM="Goniomonas sp, Strain m" /LENGTH=448 /DNA_ID=CAMNT_0001745229 /DNA_START=57 /DNA_END=1403 /DNA_ORIENTATION=-